jgi:integrase-like protein
VLELLRELWRRGHATAVVAGLLDLSCTSLYRWEQRQRRRIEARRRRGRSRREPTKAERRAAIRDAFDSPRMGSRALSAAYPSLSRRYAKRILRRVRWLRERRAYRAEWIQPGSVWAIDHTRPPALVEGVFARVLVVRDLASGFQLANEAAARESAVHVAGVLERLFEEHGAPLALKSDNGGALVGGPIPDLLAKWGVTPLRSPPYTPRFNGACEAGVGSVKRGAEWSARINGHPGEWTLDDLEAARLYANEFGRPRHARGRVPREAWEARRRVTLLERSAFLAACRAARPREAARIPTEEWPPNQAMLARLERAAVSGVLTQLHYLKLWRG